MPRRARIVVPGVPVHAIQRGNNRAPCFADDPDREFFLHHLGRLAGEEGCALHAYCLMTNHVHLLVTPEYEESCARLFKRLGREQYCALFGSHLDPGVIREIRSTTNGGYALGSKAFRAEMANLLGRPVSKGRPGRPPRDGSAGSTGLKLI